MNPFRGVLFQKKVIIDKGFLERNEQLITHVRGFHEATILVYSPGECGGHSGTVGVKKSTRPLFLSIIHIV